MSVSDPAFACQLQTQDGRIFDFDDPGCLWAFQAKEHMAPRAIFYAQNPPGNWLSEDGAAFLKGLRSPMGFGMKVVPRGTADALSPGDARTLVASRTSQEAHP